MLSFRRSCRCRVWRWPAAPAWCEQGCAGWSLGWGTCRCGNRTQASMHTHAVRESHPMSDPRSSTCCSRCQPRAHSRSVRRSVVAIKSRHHCLLPLWDSQAVHSVMHCSTTAESVQALEPCHAKLSGCSDPNISDDCMQHGFLLCSADKPLRWTLFGNHD